MIHWDRIDTVLLDMDGTLLDRHFDDTFWEEYVPEKFAALKAIPISNAKEQLYAAYKGEERTLNWTDVDYWSNRLGLDIVALKVEMSDQVRVHPGVPLFLQFLQDREKEVVLVTNAHPKTVQIKLGQTALIPYLNTTLCSSDIGVPKEEIDFWKKAEQVLLFDKARTLFIDDNETVLLAAHTFGIKYLFLKSNPSSCEFQEPSQIFPSLAHFDALIP
ncbi:MAG: GMP/IMP nucleotidase [Nitrospiria bacterium]